MLNAQMLAHKGEEASCVTDGETGKIEISFLGDSRIPTLEIPWASRPVRGTKDIDAYDKILVGVYPTILAHHLRPPIQRIRVSSQRMA